MPWLLNEDAALDSKLRGIRVTDENAPAQGRDVPVLWEMPETETQDIVYPYIGVEPLGWFHDPTREHRGYIQLPYAPEGYPEWWGQGQLADVTESPYYSYFPIPYNFDYEITVYARYQQQHLIPIVSALAQWNYIPPRFGFLNVPQDGTVRNLFLNGGPERGFARDDHDKRLLTATYNVRVCGELLGPVDATLDYGGALALASQINLDLSVYSNNAEMSAEQLASSIGVFSVGITSGWNTQ